MLWEKILRTKNRNIISTAMWFGWVNLWHLVLGFTLMYAVHFQSLLYRLHYLSACVCFYFCLTIFAQHAHKLNWSRQLPTHWRTASCLILRLWLFTHFEMLILWYVWCALYCAYGVYSAQIIMWQVQETFVCQLSAHWVKNQLLFQSHNS
jgi:hypothetical protein